MKYKIGDKVIINGNLYKSSNATTPTSTVKNKVTNITRIAKGSKHPYNTTGDLGWMDESSIKLYEEPTKEYKGELTLIDLDGLVDYIKKETDKVLVLSCEQLKKVLKL